MQIVSVTADGVRRGDVIAVGGIPHTVCDVREVSGRRKRLEFADGNAYVLGARVAIRVTRARSGGARRVPPAG
ncbi:hypothetical protein [Streptomyces sp. NPDC005408]|uniref:hypothetical protein n=1 Tax=Streptomyces sp. NPDC005408 TaxID=3155341 RepID=UPI0033AE18CD